MKYTYKRITKNDFIIPISKEPTDDDGRFWYKDIDWDNDIELILNEISEIIYSKYNVYPVGILAVSIHNVLNNMKYQKTSSHNFAGLGNANRFMYKVDKEKSDNSQMFFPILPAAGNVERNMWAGSSMLINKIGSPTSIYPDIYYIYVRKDSGNKGIDWEQNDPCGVCTSYSHCIANSVDVSKYNVIACPGPALDDSWISRYDTKDKVSERYDSNVREVEDEEN